MQAWVERRRNRALELWGRVGPRTRDIVFMVLAAVAATNQILTPPDGQLPILENKYVCAVLAVLGTVSLWWRRSRPVTVTIIGIVLMALTSVYLHLLVALFSLAIRRRDRVVAALAVFSCGAAILGTTSPERFSTGNILGAMVMIILATLCGAYIGVRRALVASLHDRIAQAEAERDLRAAQARIAERARIAREMHDVLAHRISLIALHAGALEVSAAKDPEIIEQTAQVLSSTSRQALTDLREVLGVLRSADRADESHLAPQPTIRDLPELVASSRRAGLRIDLDYPEDLDPPDIIGRTVYRIVQEALTNVHKHAPGSATRITLARPTDDSIVVEVRNTGSLATRSLLPGSGTGLVGLRERVELLGGELTAGATEDDGWSVHATIPWANPARADRSDTAELTSTPTSNRTAT